MYICTKITGLELTERIIETNDWATYLLASCFLLLALVKYIYPRRFMDFLTIPLNTKFFKLYTKDDTIQHPFSVLLFLVQVGSLSVFSTLLIKTFVEGPHNPWLPVQVFTFYSVFVIGKAIIEKIIANIFSIDASINDYLFQKLTYRNLMALILFGGNLIFIYALPHPGKALWLFALGIVLLNIIALYSIYRRNRSLIMSNFFYFILYLCALEISPYIILYNMVVSDISI